MAMSVTTHCNATALLKTAPPCVCCAAPASALAKAAASQQQLHAFWQQRKSATPRAARLCACRATAPTSVQAKKESYLRWLHARAA